MANKHQPSLEGIPLEIKRIIALHLPAADNKNLVCVSRSFREAVEPINWSAIRIRPLHIDFDRLRDWEGASPHDQQAARHAIEDARQRCADLLRRDPRKRAWVKAVRGVVLQTAAHHILDVLDLVKGSVKEISQEVCPARSKDTFTDTDTPTLARAINAVRLLPHLTRLLLWLSEGWETDAINAVRSTPRLEEFTAQAGRLAHDDFPICVTPLPRLPRLRKLHVDTKRWCAGTMALVAAASRLESLTLWISWAWSPFQIWGISNLFTVSPRLRILDLRGNNLANQLEYASTQNDLSVHWPRLEALTIHAPLCPGSLPRHKTIKIFDLWYSFGSRGDEDPCLFFGTQPSSQITGLLAGWLVDGLQGLPAVERLIDKARPNQDPPIMSDDGPIPDGFHIRSYHHPDGQAVFYHVKVLFPTLRGGLLGPHRIAYTGRPLKHREMTPHNDILSTSASSGEAITRREAVDVTSYKGFALPKTLLRTVHAMDDIDPRWTDGERRLGLSERAWQLLDGWAAQVVDEVDYEVERWGTESELGGDEWEDSDGTASDMSGGDDAESLPILEGDDGSEHDEVYFGSEEGSMGSEGSSMNSV